MFRGTQALRVLALASQKGGSGKTTLSGHLAVQAQCAGAGPVVLIDIDPQGSLADWWNEREAEYPAFAQTTVARLANDLQILRQQGFKLAVIDTPPAITMAIQSVISVAELIVVPTRPSPHDLRAVGATVDLCERAGKPLVFVVNGATPKAKITSEAAVALSQHGTVAPITLHHRTDFAASMIDGRTVMEVDPESRSAAEIAALWRYVSDRLEKISVAPCLLRSSKANQPCAPVNAPARAALAAALLSRAVEREMSESGFASLGPTLLARKGGARPAMRPQLGPVISDPAQIAKLAEEQLEDLGWNDMGDNDADAETDHGPDNVVVPIGRDTPFDAETAKTSPIVRRQQRRLEERVLADAVMTGPEECPAPDENHFAADYCEAPDETECDYADKAGYDDETGYDDSAFVAQSTDQIAAHDRANLAVTRHPVILTQVGLTRAIAARPTATPAAEKVPADKTRRAAFTLRLDRERHLKLRLAATIKGVSAQVLVTEALDSLLAEFDELDGIAARMQRH